MLQLSGTAQSISVYLRSNFTYHECHKKHYTTLCHAFTTNVMLCQTNQSHTEQLPASIDSTLAPTNMLTSTNSSGVSTNLTTTATSSLTLPLSNLYTSICLLKTAIADISAGPTTVEGHILFDERAQRSFITQQLANILQLVTIRHELITVSSFGEQVSRPTKFAVTSISIHMLNGGYIPISAPS